MQVDNFVATDRWLCQFKHCHGLVYKKVPGESATVNTNTSDQVTGRIWVTVTIHYRQDGPVPAVSQKKCWHWKACPATGRKVPKGGKLCCFLSTVMEVLTVDGKSLKPCCFKNIYIYRVFHDLWTLLQGVIS